MAKLKNMKKLVLLTLLLALQQLNHAQGINSITVNPPNPTVNDNVEIYVDMWFPNSTCAGTASWSLNGSLITGSTVHCMGMLSTVCYDIDTLAVGQLPMGTYVVFFSQSSGYGIPNCTPGFVADDQDTITFSVGPLTVPENNPYQFFSVSPNPSANGILQLKNLPATDAHELLVYTIDGRLAETQPIAPGQETVSLQSAAGIYMLRVRSGSFVSDTQKVVITRN
jgi:hypothetical protein